MHLYFFCTGTQVEESGCEDQSFLRKIMRDCVHKFELSLTLLQKMSLKIELIVLFFKQMIHYKYIGGNRYVSQSSKAQPFGLFSDVEAGCSIVLAGSACVQSR